MRGLRVEKPYFASRGAERGERARAALTSAVLLGMVLYPILQNWRRRPRDSFPFSYYPMFSARRGDTAEVTYAQGATSSGAHAPLHFKYIGAGGLNQVRRQLRRLVRDGGAEETCLRVAQRVASARDSQLRDIVEVRVVTGDFVLDDFSGGLLTCVSETVHAAHPVPRSSQ
jgi:hypothetical protein